MTFEKPGLHTAERVHLEDSLQDVYENLEKRVEERTREIEVISEVGRVITSDPNISRVYERFTAEMKRLVEFDRMVHTPACSRLHRHHRGVS